MLRPLIALALLLALLAAACSNDDADSPTARITPNPELPANESLLFIARGDASARDGHIIIDTTHVEWFTDRPDRMAGFTTLETFAALWQTAFAGDPPTAAIAGNDIQAVVTLNTATATGDSLDLTFQDINSSVPDGGLGPISLFVDSGVAGFPGHEYSVPDGYIGPTETYGDCGPIALQVADEDAAPIVVTNDGTVTLKNVMLDPSALVTLGVNWGQLKTYALVFDGSGQSHTYTQAGSYTIIVSSGIVASGKHCYLWNLACTTASPLTCVLQP